MPLSVTTARPATSRSSMAFRGTARDCPWPWPFEPWTPSKPRRSVKRQCSSEVEGSGSSANRFAAWSRVIVVLMTLPVRSGDGASARLRDVRHAHRDVRGVRRGELRTDGLHVQEVQADVFTELVLRKAAVVDLLQPERVAIEALRPLDVGDGHRDEVGALNDQARSSLTNRSLHLELDQAVHLDCVLERELLRDRLHEAADDHRRGL